MRLRLDGEACQGHGRCYALAPDIFESDEEGYSVLRIGGEIPAELEEGAILAVENCPEFAISVDPPPSPAPSPSPSPGVL